MIRRLSTVLLSAGLLLGVPVSGQAQALLTLPQAVARARAQNPDAGAAAAAEREAAQRVIQARAGYFPKVDVTEAWQRGNQPVFVFGSLLAQRRFTANDFALDALNRPDAVDNFRAAVTIEQSLFDGATRARVRSAGLGQEMAAAGRQLADHRLVQSVTDAYGRVLVAEATAASAAAGVETARSDRALASDRRDAGRVTDADVLQADVYLARMLERQVQATAEARIARARLNQLIGEPLDAAFVLEAAGAAPVDAAADPAALAEEAVKRRPEVAIAALQEQLAQAAVAAARAAYLPQVSAQAGWERNGGTWGTRASSWVAGAVARINLFHGFADRARLAEAREQVTRRGFEREQAETAARLDVQIALARLDAARASEAVGRAAVEQARESRRIIRDRYESGLTDAVSLLRAAEAVQDAETQQIAARVSVLTAAAALDRAMGTP